MIEKEPWVQGKRRRGAGQMNDQHNKRKAGNLKKTNTGDEKIERKTQGLTVRRLEKNDTAASGAENGKQKGKKD